MKLFGEDESSFLHILNYQIDAFRYEVDAGEDYIDMHQYFIQNRDILLGQYIYVLHEAELSAESFIDFIGFTENGAVLLIEIKRGADSRNRQEVVAQIGKYAMDAFSISTIAEDMEKLKKRLSDPKLHNKPISGNLLERIKTNVQNSNLNLFLITEDATDELLASIYYLSYGKRNRKISVLELKRHNVNGQRFCALRHFNKQPLLNSARKGEMSLKSKLSLMGDVRLQEEISRVVEDWLEMGFSIAPLTISTPEYFTFEWKKGQSVWVSFYVLERQQKNLSGAVKKNSMAIHVDNSHTDQYREIIDWAKRQNGYYSLKTNNRGKAKDYHLHCIDVSDYESDAIDAVLSRIREIAIMKKDDYFAI